MKISIIISTHGEGRDLNRILSCLELQRNYVLQNGDKGSIYYAPKEYLHLYEPLPYAESAVETIIVSHGKFTGPYPDSVYEVPYVEGSYGHHARALGIQLARGDWIALTNSDNLYVDGWLCRVIHFINKYPKLGLLHWKCVNNYANWGTSGGPNIRKSGTIDMCCVMVKSNIAKKVGFPWRHMAADFNFIDGCRKMCERRKLDVIYIPEILAVHN